MIRYALLRTLFIACSAALLFPCAWEMSDDDMPDHRISFFDQSVVGDGFFKNFYPNANDAIAYFSDPPRVSDDALYSDWKTYFKSTYRVTPSMNELKEAVSNYSAFSRITKKDDPSMKAYIAYMTEVNAALGAYQERRMESWRVYTQDEKKAAVAQFDVFAKRAVTVITDSKPGDFFSLRYGFQAVRFAVLAERFDDAVQYYADHVAPRRGSTMIGYQALGYKARALYKKGDRAGALALYLEIFDQCPPLMAQTLQSMYLTCTKSEFDAYRAKQDNKHKLTTAGFVWALLQKRDFSRDTLAPLLATGPAQTKPEIILTRMIQMIEKESWADDRHQFTGGGKVKNDYDGLISLCAEAGGTAGIRQSALWLTGAAYLSLLAGKTADAEKHLASAAAAKASRAMTEQMHCTATLLALQKDQKTFTADMQSRLAVDLAWAERMQESNPRMRDSLLTLTAQRFLTANDTARAIAAFSLVAEGTASYLIDCVSEDSELFVLEGLLTKRPSGATLDGIIFTRTAITADDIICARGMKALRREDTVSAIKHFDRLSAAFNKKFPAAYTFDSPPIKNNATYIPSHDKFIAACKVKNVTLAEFARLIADAKALSDGTKQKRLSSTAIKGEPSLMLGNLWYSLFLSAEKGSFSGNASKATISGSAHSAGLRDAFPLGLPGVSDKLKRAFESYTKEVDNFAKAERAYAKAMSSKDREAAARACMNANIARGIYLNADSKKNDLSAKDAEYLSAFSKKFSDTRFYKETIDQCPLLQMY